MIVASSFILTGLCFLVVNIKEGSVLAQSDILQYAIKAVIFLTIAVSMVLGASAFISEREENTMESLLLTPVSKLNLTAAKYAGVMTVGVLIYIASVPYLIAIGYGSGLVLRSVFITFFGGLLLLSAFVAISIIFSIVMKSSKASVLMSILIMIVLALPAFIQGVIKTSSIGAFILKTDPFVRCFNMISKTLTDKVSFFSLWNYIIPLVVFAAASVAAMILFSRKIALKGEE